MKRAGTASATGILTLPQRAPFPMLALALCLTFAMVGIAVLGDYGIGGDEDGQRRIARENIEYIKGDAEALHSQDRFFGIALELPLLLAERLLGLEQNRDIYRMRHLATHLLFIVGGLFCGLLAHRMFGSRWLAVLAMLLFLLHPRLHAHSFFNSKDPTFAAMFMIALFLIHRAFRKGSLGAFALCGIAVGLAFNLRIFGLLLLPAVLGMRALDLWNAASRLERRRVLATGGLFAATALTTMYSLHPYYWANPLRVIEGFQVLSQHPVMMDNLFQGEIVRSDAVPPHYIPTWFAISSPPLALLLGIVGVAATCGQGIAHPRSMLGNGELRFRFLLVGCLVLPVGVVVGLDSNIYDGWRQFQFLWAPCSLLAAVGLRWLAGIRRGLAYGLTGAGLAGVAVAMAQLHPHQQIYFNLLVNRMPPGALAQEYDMDYWLLSQRQGYEQLRTVYPDASLRVGNLYGMARVRQFLPASARRQLAPADAKTADFYIGDTLRMRQRKMPSEPVIHRREAYGSPYLLVVAPKLVWGGGPSPDAEAYRAAHRSLVAASKPAARAHFDVYLEDGALHYVKEDCNLEDAEARFFLHLFPVEAKDLPLHRRKHHFDNRDFDFGWRGAHFDGKCMTQAPLPGYPIARIRTGQFVSGEGQLWKVEVPLP